MLNINNVLKNNYHILINILLILSIYIGFFLGENITQGPKMDFEHALNQVNFFKYNFSYTFFNYDEISNSTRISPIFTSTLYFVNEVTNNLDLTRFILLNILLLNQIFFYKCLKISSVKLSFDKKILLVLSSIIYLSPSFRANIIWPESAMLGLLFFLISLYYFIKFTKLHKIKYIVYNILFLAIASYVRPSYCLFSIYFFFKFFSILYSHDKLLIKLSLIVILNIILSIPAFYYVFVLDVFFIKDGGLSNNYFNKVSIITSIIFFHLLPILYLYKANFNFNFKKDLNFIFISLISLILIVYNFNYDLNLSGGGIILHVSNLILDNNVFFYIFYSISAFFILKTIFLDKLNNFLLILILIMITPQYHIFHKYYDPLIIILAMTLFNFQELKNFVKKINFILIIYGFYISLNLAHLINKYLV